MEKLKYFLINSSIDLGYFSLLLNTLRDHSISFLLKREIKDSDIFSLSDLKSFINKKISKDASFATKERAEYILEFYSFDLKQTQDFVSKHLLNKSTSTTTNLCSILKTLNKALFQYFFNEVIEALEKNDKKEYTIAELNDAFDLVSNKVKLTRS